MSSEPVSDERLAEIVDGGEYDAEITSMARELKQARATLKIISDGPPSTLDNGEVAQWAAHIAQAGLPMTDATESKGVDINTDAIERIHASLVAFTKQRESSWQTVAPMRFDDVVDLAIMLRALRSSLTAARARIAELERQLAEARQKEMRLWPFVGHHWTCDALVLDDNDATKLKGMSCSCGLAAAVLASSPPAKASS